MMNNMAYFFFAPPIMPTGYLIDIDDAAPPTGSLPKSNQVLRGRLGGNSRLCALSQSLIWHITLRPNWGRVEGRVSQYHKQKI